MSRVPGICIPLEPMWALYLKTSYQVSMQWEKEKKKGIMIWEERALNNKSIQMLNHVQAGIQLGIPMKTVNHG